MHGPNFMQFYKDISVFLVWYYLFLALLNAGAAFYLWRTGRGITLVGRLKSYHCWVVLALLFTMIAPLAASGDPEVLQWISLPGVVRDWIDWLMGPVVYSVGSVVALGVLFVGRRFFVKPTVGWIMLNAALLFMGLAMTDPDFAEIVRKPDNVPIVGLIYLLGFFTWLSAHKAVENDDRIRKGLPPKEKELDEKVLVWPDLVYTELICMVAVTAFLLVWAILIKAPLEEPASAVKTPNPSKAPWYFLGLQEMLVYYDPWMAGVVLPSLIIFGLMAIPYLDFNKKGNGYYTIDERKFSYIVFQFGFIILWVTLIVLGTFLRGPNWNFFGPFETWDAHKVEALNNVDLSEFFWVHGLQRARPRPPENASTLVKAGYILLRELPGIVLLGIYFSAMPSAMVVWSRFFRELFVKMGLIRYMTMMFLLQVMLLLPIKMVCRWSFNLKYFVAIPELMLNF